MNWVDRTKAKYGNEKAERDGYSFGSKLERAVYDLLKLHQTGGGIVIMQTQAHVYLSRARILYIPDFKCMDERTKEIFFVEAKGFEGARWPTIKKLWKSYGPGNLQIWKGHWLKPYLDEVIEPNFEGEE